MTIKRRSFIGNIAAGSAIVTLPGFLSGCSVPGIPSAPAPTNPFMDWFGVDERSIASVMSELSAGGADLADIYFQHSRQHALMLEEGIVQGSTSDIQQGVGLRVVRGEQTGYAYTEDLTLASMQTAARTAALIAKGASPVPPEAFNPAASGDLYTTTVAWSDVTTEAKLAKLEFIERTAKSKDPSIEKVTVYWHDGDERVMIATLDGRLVSDHRPLARVTVVVTAKRGDAVQTGFANLAARAGLDWFDEERLGVMVEEAVERTLVQFDAIRAPLGEMPVILAAGASGVLLHEAIGHGLEADFNRNGTSSYRGKMGEQVAESFVTLVDQATLPGEPGALNYDDEGSVTGRTVMVENGVLKSYLHDEISARHYGLTTTGSARRESYKHAPMPRMTCTFMQGGPHEKDEIIAAVDKGIICETYTDGRVEPGAGDFTFGVKNGWLVERGKIAAPIKDISISGNGPELLQRIKMVADDLTMDAGGWTCGKKGQRVPVSQGMPTVLVSNLMVENGRGG